VTDSEFRLIVTGDFGNVTGCFGIVTTEFGRS